MAPMAGPHLVDLWSDYWRDAGLHGCTEGLPETARSTVAARWRGVFGRFDPSTRLLDLGSGKGALLALAAESGWTRLQGCDLARLDTPLPIAGGIDLRAVPYRDLAFDLVVSQFGLEYAGLDAAADEAARVCSGAMMLLVHAQEGELCHQSREQALQCRWLIEELGFFARLAQHFAAPTMATAAGINHALGDMARAAATAANRSLLDGVIAAATGLQDGPDPRAGAAMLERDVAGYGARLDAMVEAAPDALAVAGLSKRLSAHGFTVRVDDECHGGALFARWVIATRGDDGWFDRYWPR